MDNGATLWFSAVMGGYGGYLNGGSKLDLTLANNSFFNNSCRSRKLTCFQYVCKVFCFFNGEVTCDRSTA